MVERIKKLGIVLTLFGMAFIVGSGYAYIKVQEGQTSLNAFSAAQNVKLTYNEQGQLTDRGTTEGAQAIMALLVDEWKYPVNMGELNPADPVVNTGSEYMFQMATVAYHTLHGVQTVVLTEDVEYKGEIFKAGTHEFPVNGRYWADFDRAHPLEGPARAQAWTGVAHALIAELGVGTATASSLQMGLGLAALFAGIGITFIFGSRRPIAPSSPRCARAWPRRSRSCGPSPPAEPARPPSGRRPSS